MDSRNVQVEAMIDNPKHQLLPGMFVSIQVQAGAAVQYTTLPQSAVSFNPYGETVYVIEDKGKDKEGKSRLSVKQSFIITGETRGDQVAVLKGIKEGDMIVSVGAHKLRNGSSVNINNDVLPSNEASPKIEDK
jgi:membrane fusion protein (multidrug efflux system)